MSVVEILFLGTFSTLWTVFLFYFTLMLYFSRKPNNVNKKRIFPSVSLVIPVFNEEATIQQKLANINELDYPKEKIEVVVVDDGSTDNTRKIVQNSLTTSKFNTRLLMQDERRGKAHALNYAWKFCRGDIVIISDADVFFDKDSISQMVTNFHDTQVGAVSGIQVILNPSSSNRIEQEYRVFYNTLRMGETNLDSVVMCESGFSAYRRELIEGIPEKCICDDMELTLRVRAKGYRAVYDPNVKFYEYSPIKLRSMFKQKIRRGQGNQQTLLHFMRMMFRRKYAVFGFIILPCEFFMHIVSPILTSIYVLSYLLITINYSNAFLILFPIILLSLTLLGVFFALRFISPATSITLECGSNKKLPFEPLSMIIGFLGLQLCLLIGLVSLTFGRSKHKWEKIEEVRSGVLDIKYQGTKKQY